MTAGRGAREARVTREDHLADIIADALCGAPDPPVVLRRALGRTVARNYCPHTDEIKSQLD